MPYASDIKPEDWLLRTLIYGDAKTKKTWWACRVAEAGFNALLLDGDDGALITNQLPLKARQKILAVNLVMTQHESVFAKFMTQFLRPNKGPFIWDEQAKKTVMGLVDPKHSHIKIDPNLLTPNDVVILDGWKALAESSLFDFAKENNLDLSDAAKTEWSGYNFQGNFLNWVLARLHTLPCHIIVVGHAMVYEKWDRRSPNPKEHKLIEQRTQPISSSGPHGKKLASHFTDVLYFRRLSTTAFKIDATGDYDRDGGSRLIEPKTYSWEELGPEILLGKLGAKPTGEPCKAAIWYAAGEEVPRGLGAVNKLGDTPIVAASTAPPVIQNVASQGSGGLMERLKINSRKGG